MFWPGPTMRILQSGFPDPTTIYTWFHLGITLSKTEAIPPNYVDLLREVCSGEYDARRLGADVVPQQFMSELYKACSGISYIDNQALHNGRRRGGASRTILSEAP